MKKIISVLFCVVLLFSAFSFSAFAVKDENETEETTAFMLEIDVNQRYTDILDATDDAEFYQINGAVEDKDNSESLRTIYIAVLVAALVVAVIILAVSLKRVPKEENIDISGEVRGKKE